jgi:hypothetical protein
MERRIVAGSPKLKNWTRLAMGPKNEWPAEK